MADGFEAAIAEWRALQAPRTEKGAPGAKGRLAQKEARYAETLARCDQHRGESDRQIPIDRQGL